MNVYKCTGQLFQFGKMTTYLKEEVDKIWVLFQFGTNYTKELNLFIFCRSSQHVPT